MNPGETAPAISVIVAMYNCAPYIEECLGSLKNQTFGDFEAICIDDASTDDTCRIAKAFVEGDARFTFIEREENGGQSIARNNGLDQARGEYILLLDSDDYFAPEAFEKLIGRAREQQLDDLFFSALAVYESAEAHRLIREVYDHRASFDGVATGKELFTFFEERGCFFPQAPFRMVRRSLIEENGIRFYEGIIHEDVLFSFLTVVNSERSSLLNEVLYFRRVRLGSTMTTPKRTLKNIEGHFLCAQEMTKWLHGHAGELDENFIAAATHRIDDYYNFTSTDWHSDIDDEDKRRYIESLTPDQKIEFYQNIVHRGETLLRIEREFYESKTYRLGNILVSLPRSIKKKRLERKRYSEDIANSQKAASRLGKTEVDPPEGD